MTFLRDGVEIDANGKPVGEPGKSDTQDVATLTAERDAAVQKQGELENLKAELTQQLAAVKADLDQSKSGAAEAGQKVTALQAQVTTLTAERDAAQKAVKDGKLLPADALDRLIAVPGIAKALAEKALAALSS